MIKSKQSPQVLPARHGVTLIELLIVVGMLAILAAIALPNIRDVIREQRVSRAAGAVQAFFDGARAKAIGDGQPYGVIIERANSNSAVNRSQSIQLRYAYGPPAYSGDVAGAVAVVLESGHLVFSPSHAATLVAAANQAENGASDPIVQTGDIVRLGLVGAPLSIKGIRYARENDFDLDDHYPEQRENPGFVPENWPNGRPTAAQISDWPVVLLSNTDRRRIRSTYHVGTTLQFSVDRRPRPSMLSPLEMVRGSAIDLLYSGVGLAGWQFSPFAIEEDPSPGSAVFTTADREYGPITIMFDSQGSVSEVFGAQLAGGGALVESRSRVSSNIYLLIGKTGGVLPASPLAEDVAATPNILDLESIWVVINRQSGEVYTATVDALPRDPDGVVLVPGNNLSEQLTNAIQMSRQSISHYFTGT